MNPIYAVIMAGGSGERFWPKSRRHLPKQLLPIVSRKSMLKETLARLEGIVPKNRIFIFTNKVQKKLAKKETGCRNIIAEPLSKNTAPCIAVAGSIIQKKDTSSVMIVLPSDHQIRNIPRFRGKILNAIKIADRYNVLVTIGIKPRGPHTGYGYIKKGDRVGLGLYKVSEFTEKPDLKTAKRYLASSKYLWNSGIFIWKAGAILDEIKKYMPKLYLLCKKGNINNIYRTAENISIDYGVMEKTQRAVVLEAGFNWDDVGNWASLDKHIKKDKRGNIIQGNVVSKDVNNSTIITDSPLVSAIGIKDMIVVGTKDAVLVCPKNRAEEVKDIAGMLKGNKRYTKYL